MWSRLPIVQSPTPVLSLLAGRGVLWAGGLGGVARHVDDAWEPRIADLAVTSIMTLANHGHSLFAGGIGGVARSTDDGGSWRTGAMPDPAEVVTCVAVSPAFDEDGTVLAGTLDSGVLRSTDAGLTWIAANFGLGAQEITCLSWLEHQVVLAGTANGMFRSGNGGRAWKPVPGLPGEMFAGIAACDGGSVVAVSADGRCFHSANQGQSWAAFGAAVPLPVEVNAVVAIGGDKLLLGTSGQGVLRTTAGEAWTQVADDPVLSLALAGGRVIAGTDRGLLFSDDAGVTWASLESPPLHDLRHLDVMGESLLVSGFGSPPVMFSGDEWQTLDAMPLQVSCIAVGWNGSLLVSTPDGLFHSTDQGVTWQNLIDGEAGWMQQMTVLESGEGWLVGASDSRLLHTPDAGATWESLGDPFAGRTVAALMAIPAGVWSQQTLVAATHEERQGALTIWRSEDDGITWQVKSRVETEWPGVSILPEPPVISVGNVVLLALSEDRWERFVVKGRGVRRMVQDAAHLVVLSTSGIWSMRNRESGEWQPLHDGLAMDRVMDIAMHEGRVYCLLAGGEVMVRDPD